MADDAAYHVATVRKNALEEVQVALTEFRGLPLVDVRVFADFDGTGGERRATKKGISIRIESLPDLIDALEKARTEAARRGLIAERQG